MEQLLSTLILVALTGFADRTALLAAAMATRFGTGPAVLTAAVLAAIGNAALSAAAGAAIGGWISRDALAFFYGFALAVAGLGMLIEGRRVDPLTGWRLGAFATSLIGIALIQLGDKGQFIIAATAARSHAPVMAAIGGAIGAMLALVPAIMLREQLAARLPLRAIRGAGGVLLIALGLYLMLRARGLIA